MSHRGIKPIEYRFRKYQIDLYDSARDENIIAVLGTGTGKTFIALMLISDAKFADQLSGSYRTGAAKRTFFLAPTRPLAKQQDLVIRTSPQTSHLKTKCYTGDMDIGIWDKKRWDEELEQTQVLVVTPQILLDLLTKSFVTFDKINILVFDEVHWAARTRNRKDSGHPYKQIMKLYSNLSTDQRPRVLGLSATPINCTMKIDKFEDAIEDIERTYLAVCKTADVGKYGVNPKETIWTFSAVNTCRSPSAPVVAQSLDLFINTLRKYNDIRRYPTTILKVKRCLMNIRNMLSTQNNLSFVDEELGVSFPVLMSWMGVWCASVCTKKYIEELSEQKDLILGIDPNQYLLMDCTMNYLILLKDVFDNELKSDPMAVLNTSSPKMYRLLELLRNYRPIEGKESILCGIVFVNQRCVAKVLAEWLMKLKHLLPEEYGFLRVSHVVGHSSRPDFDGKFSNNAEQNQQKVIEKFRKEELNLLIATSVLEEGLDVRQCNLVVKYDRLNTFREYLQARGRARAQDAHFYMMTSVEDSYRLQRQLRDFRYMEEKLKNINKLVKTPFLEPESAINLLYNYCKNLCSDSQPILEVKREKFGYRGKVILPTSCPLNETIEGQLDYDRDMAKMLAAVKACQKLQTYSELDQSFLPMANSIDGKRKYSVIEDPEPEWPEELINPSKRLRTEFTVTIDSYVPTNRTFGTSLQIDNNSLLKSLITKTDSFVIKFEELMGKCSKKYFRNARKRKTFGRRRN